MWIQCLTPGSLIRITMATLRTWRTKLCEYRRRDRFALCSRGNGCGPHVTCRGQSIESVGIDSGTIAGDRKSGIVFASVMFVDPNGLAGVFLVQRVRIGNID